MAGSLAGPASGGGWGVTVVLDPPIEFILRQTGRFRQQLMQLDGLWERLIPLVAGMEREQFETHAHGAWPPLAESTIRDRSRGGTEGSVYYDILVRTGRLRDSLIDPAAAARTTERALIWETSVPYARFHQQSPDDDYGFVAGRPPKRQVIPDPIPVDTRRRFETETVRWINDVAAGTFGRS